jgi:hypothetical protein
MREEEKTVIKIQQFLNSIDQTENAEYAEIALRYAKICIALNRRLEECCRLIKNDSIGIALHRAEEEPPILEVVELLEFNGADEWKEICELYDWKTAPEIKSDLLGILKKAYVNNLSLEPLLVEYRKKFKKVSLKEKIALLRRINAVDSDSTQREEDLSRLENERLKELKKAARKAIEEDDEVTIQNIYAELNSPGWLVKPPENVISRLEQELIQFDKMRFRERGKKVLHEISNAYSNYNMEDLAAALDKWDALLKEDLFTPEASDKKQVMEARRWFDSENSELEKQRLFTKLLKQFAEDMDQKINLTKIDNLYNKLLEFDMPVPEHLLKRYRQVRSDLELDARRGYTKKLVISLLMISVLVAGLGYLIHLHLKAAEYKQWAGPILQATETHKLTDLHAALKSLEQLKSEHPDFYNTEMVKAESKIKADISQIENTIKEAYDAIAGLEKIIKNNYADYDRMENLIETADLLFRKLKDEKGRLQLARIRRAKKAYEIRTQDERDSKFTENAIAMNKLKMAVDSIEPEEEPDEFRKALTTYETAVQSLLTQKGVSPEIFSKYSDLFENNIKMLHKELLDSKERHREKQALLETINAGKLYLPSYSLAIKRLIDKYPGTAVSAKYAKILKMMPGYMNAAALKHLSPRSLNKKGIQKYAEFLKLHPARNIWRRDLKEFLTAKLTYIENKDNVVAALNVLQNLQVMKFKVLRFKNKSGDKIYFYTDEAVARKFSTINTTTFCRIWARVMENDVKNEKKSYIFQQHDQGWDVTAGKVKLYRNLKPLDKIEREIPVAAHASLCMALNLDIAGRPPEEYEETILKRIKELKADKEVNSFIKLQLMQRFYSLAEKISLHHGDEFHKGGVVLAKLLQACERLNWIQLDKESKKRIDDVISKLADISGNIENETLRFKILKVAVGRQIREIGTAAFVNGKVDVIPVVKADFREIWALKEENGVLKFVIVGKKDSTGIEIFPEYRTLLSDGEPLFAPFDNRSTKELTEKFFEGVDAAREVRRPDSWPVGKK